MVLRFAQDQAAKKGVTLNVGEFPSGDEAGADDTDPTRVTRVTAHALARVADRVPFSRKLSRHFEGTDSRAGLFSDLLTLLTELAKRNPDLVKSRLESFGDDLSKARMSRAQQAQQAQTPNTGAGNSATL